jgi:hypothetical protein
VFPNISDILDSASATAQQRSFSAESASALHLDLGSFAGFGLVFSLGLGLALEPCSVFAAGLPFALLGRVALRGLVGPRKQLIQPHCPVVLRGQRRHRLILRTRPGIRFECTPWRPGFSGVNGGLVLAGDGTRRTTPGRSRTAP